MASTGLSAADLEFIREAAQFFEKPSLFVRSLNWVGKPLEMAQRKLPLPVRNVIAEASKAAIEKALSLSIGTLRAPAYAFTSHRHLHSGVAAFIGGFGGFFGVTALPLELPVATLIMLRSIADIARQHGHDLSTPEVRLECIYVFSLGTSSDKDDAMESAYYTSRLVFADVIKNASVYLSAVGTKEVLGALDRGAAPVLARLVAQVASRFEVQVSQKFVAQMAPVAGALGGAGINFLFTNFYNDCARFHFGLKRLEKERGYEITRKAFESARAVAAGRSPAATEE